MSETRIGLIFHGIGTPERVLESGEVPYWISTDRFEAVLDQIDGAPRPDLIRISFDDGNRSDHDIALPRLLARGLTADFFVLSGRIGSAGSLDARQVRALMAAGMGIGSHGVDHRDWQSLTGAELEAELALSRATLESICGQPVRTAGIPFGRYDARVLRGLRRAGYDCAYSSDRGTMAVTDFLRPRTSVRAAMTAAEMADILAGRMAPSLRLRRAVGMARRRWF